MAVTLSDWNGGSPINPVVLPIDLIWSDEYGFSHVSQVIKKSLTGALIIQEAIQPKGRKLGIKGGLDAAWIDRDTLIEIRTKYETVDHDMELIWHGVSYKVRFDRSGNISPVMTKEIYELADPDAEHVYSITTLKLFEV